MDPSPLTIDAAGPPAERLPRAAIVCVAGGLMLIPAFVHLELPGRYWGPIHFGGFFGTIWGQVTTAAVWCALRPGSWTARVRGAAGWLVAVAAAVSLGARSAYEPLDVALNITLAIAGLWLLLQPPLLVLRRGFGVRLSRHTADIGPRAPLQFGVRHLLIFTTVIAGLLGLGRVLVALLASTDRSSQDLLGIVQLTLGALFSGLPLALAVFIRRYGFLCLAVALAFGALVIVLERKWMQDWQFGPDPEVFWAATFVFQSAWLLLLGGILRAHGYRCVRVAGVER